MKVLFFLVLISSCSFRDSLEESYPPLDDYSDGFEDENCDCSKCNLNEYYYEPCKTEFIPSKRVRM